MNEVKEERDLRSELIRVFSDNCDTQYMYWSGNLDAFWQGSYYEDDLDEEVTDFFESLGTIDHWVANAFRCSEQLLLLLAEKEGFLPKFSDRLSDNTEIIDFYNTEIEEGNEIFEAAFDACCKEYGFSFPDKFNYSPYSDRINGDPSKLAPCILEKLNLLNEKSAETMLDAIDDGANLEVIDERLKQYDFEYIVCLSNEKANKLIRKYSRLSNVRKSRIKDQWKSFVHTYNSLLTSRCFDFSYDEEIISSKISKDFYITIGFIVATQAYYGKDTMKMRPRMIFDKDILFGMQSFATKTMKEFEAVLLPEYEAWKAGASHRKSQAKYRKKKKAENKENKKVRRRRRRYVKTTESQKKRVA